MKLDDLLKYKGNCKECGVEIQASADLGVWICPECRERINNINATKCE